MPARLGVGELIILVGILRASVSDKSVRAFIV